MKGSRQNIKDSKYGVSLANEAADYGLTKQPLVLNQRSVYTEYLNELTRFLMRSGKLPLRDPD